MRYAGKVNGSGWKGVLIEVATGHRQNVELDVTTYSRRERFAVYGWGFFLASASFLSVVGLITMLDEVNLMDWLWVWL